MDQETLKNWLEERRRAGRCRYEEVREGWDDPFALMEQQGGRGQAGDRSEDRIKYLLQMVYR